MVEGRAKKSEKLPREEESSDKAVGGQTASSRDADDSISASKIEPPVNEDAYARTLGHAHRELGAAGGSLKLGTARGSLTPMEVTTGGSKRTLGNESSYRHQRRSDGRRTGHHHKRVHRFTSKNHKSVQEKNNAMTYNIANAKLNKNTKANTYKSSRIIDSKAGS